MRPFRQTLRAIARLLDCPQGDSTGLQAELRRSLDDEHVLSAGLHGALLAFAADIERGDSYELAGIWLATFDRESATSLRLSEHLHGETQERGQARVDRPDHLPAFLERLSSLAPEVALAGLRDTAWALDRLAHSLTRIGSAYALLPAALLELADASRAE